MVNKDMIKQPGSFSKLQDKSSSESDPESVFAPLSSSPASSSERFLDLGGLETVKCGLPTMQTHLPLYRLPEM